MGCIGAIQGLINCLHRVLIGILDQGLRFWLFGFGVGEMLLFQKPI